MDASFLVSALRGGYSLHFGKQLLSYVMYASTSIAMTNKINMYLSTGTIFTDHSAVTFHMHGEDKKGIIKFILSFFLTGIYFFLSFLPVYMSFFLSSRYMCLFFFSFA
jgi:hypothetical protein